MLYRRAVLAGIGSSALLTSSRVRANTGRSEPAHLNAHSGAHDSRRRAALVFGGADHRRVLRDLWQFRFGEWRLLSRSGPAPRTFAAVAYDSSRDRLVVFGGNRVLFGTGGDTILGDHWEWDGRRWSRFDGRCPPGRTEACLAFDSHRRVLVLFGGWRFENGERVRLGDLWEFHGAKWVRSEAIGPEPRSGGAIAYDQPGRRLLVAGGNGPRAELWALDGSGWSRLPDMPQPRFNPCLATRPGSSQALLFGGWTGLDRLAATAQFDGERWHPLQVPEPAARNHSLLVPADDGSRLLLIGGHNGDEIFGDIWDWTGRWRPLRLTEPRARVPNDH